MTIGSDIPKDVILYQSGIAGNKAEQAKVDELTTAYRRVFKSNALCWKGEVEHKFEVCYTDNPDIAAKYKDRGKRVLPITDIAEVPKEETPKPKAKAKAKDTKE